MLPGDAAVLMRAHQSHLLGSQCHMAEKTCLIYENNALFSCQWKGQMAAGLTLFVIETVKSTSLLLEQEKNQHETLLDSQVHLHNIYTVLTVA